MNMLGLPADVVFASLSAIATFAAAIAAFLSSRAIKQSNEIARRAALATHHRDARRALADELSPRRAAIEALDKAADGAAIHIPAMAEEHDDREAGGGDPKPIRHVIQEAAEIALDGLESPDQKLPRGRILYRLMSPVRDGGAACISEDEGRSLSRRVDGNYGDYRSMFGENGPITDISKSAAFRLALYQMKARLPTEDVQKIIGDLWATTDGYISRLVESLDDVREDISGTRHRLHIVRAQTNQSPFPLSDDAGLESRFEQVDRALDCIEDTLSVDVMFGSEVNPPDYLAHCYLIQYVALAMFGSAVSQILLGCTPGKYDE